jgi:hypothetical protein
VVVRGDAQNLVTIPTPANYIVRAGRNVACLNFA